MRRIGFLLFIGLLAFFLAGCGEKSKDEVLDKLTEQAEKIKGYKYNAKMSLAFGTEKQEYNVEVWHQKPEYYRVYMKNAARDQSQMILRNKDGVYVLTPSMNKSFKFRSDWPKNSSQPYFYESLIKDLSEDQDAKFTQSKDYYVFEGKTRYQYNKSLPYQQVTFRKKDLSPVSVKVMDQDRKVMLTVEFTDIKFNAPFDDKAFDLNRNMSSALLEVPAAKEEADSNFIVKIPMAEIPGAELVDEEEVMTGNGKRVVMTYDGEKSFTFMQEKIHVKETAAMPTLALEGDPVDLGFTVGVLTDHSLLWADDGVEYMIASNDLSREEMVMLAKSVDAASEK